MKKSQLYLILIFTLIACNNNDSSTSLEENAEKTYQLKDEKVDTNDSLHNDNTSAEKREEGISEEEIKSYFADKNNIELALKNCLKNTQSSKDALKCITEATKVLDIELNKRFQARLSGQVDEEFGEPKVVDEVRKSMEAWLKFRKQELYFISHHLFVKDGKIQYSLLAERTIEITKFKSPKGNSNPKYKDKEVFEWCKDYSNYGMRKCAQETSKYYDKILNDKYQAILNQLDKKGKESLKKTQLAWIKYDRAESGIYSKIQELFKGSMYPTMSMQNGTRIVRQRAKELDYYYSLLNKDKTYSTFPKPDAAFFIGLDSSDVDGILKKYMEHYKIRNTYTDNYDGSNIFELKGYRLDEVKSVLKMLITVDDDLENGWNDSGYDYLGMCNLEVYERKNIIFIDYGCSC